MSKPSREELERILEMARNTDFGPEWQCGMCKRKSKAYRRRYDLVLGNPKDGFVGICGECNDKIDEANPNLKRERDRMMRNLKFGGSI